MVWYDRVILKFDGASRHNPHGPAGCGWVLIEMDEFGAEEYCNIATGNEYLGYNVSNNQAEYQGLINGLQYIQDYISCNKVYVRGDSEIIINQMLGDYKVNSRNIRPYFNEAKEIESQLQYEGMEIYYRHISRAKNWEADELANRAIDV